MSLIWTPSAPFEHLERVMDDVFDGTMLHSPRSAIGNTERAMSSGGFRPRMNVYEDAEKNIVTATFELPGMKRENVNIDMQNGRLMISGEVMQSMHENKDRFVVCERRSGKFSRALQLPNGVKPENVKAALNDGVLTVTWPKSTPDQAAKRIAIL